MSDRDGPGEAETADPVGRPDELADRTTAEGDDATADESPTPDTDEREPTEVTQAGSEKGAGEADGTTAETAPPAPAEVEVEELTGPERTLHPRVRYVWVLQAAITGVVFGVMAGIPGFFILEEPLVGPAVFLLVFGIGATLAVFRYRRWSYEVREDSLFLDRGVITQTRTVVPYVRIQHVDASRGPVERAFGLATAVVYTAGSRGADVSIPGLTPERADDLQDRLKRLAIAAEGEDAV
jgi:hypothetical protein